jgi:hypothetical protein
LRVACFECGTRNAQHGARRLQHETQITKLN